MTIIFGSSLLHFFHLSSLQWQPRLPAWWHVSFFTMNIPWCYWLKVSISWSLSLETRVTRIWPFQYEWKGTDKLKCSFSPSVSQHFLKLFNVSLCSLQFAQSSFTTGLGAWGTGVAGALGIFWPVTASTVCRRELCSGNISHFWVCGVFRWQSQEDLGFLGPRSFLVS